MLLERNATDTPEFNVDVPASLLHFKNDASKVNVSLN